MRVRACARARVCVFKCVRVCVCVCVCVCIYRFPFSFFRRYLVGAAATDEARGAYNSGLMNAGVEGRYSGLHIRGPQLNPQRDPRWGRSMESPGESAYINGEYGAQVVLGGQGALPNGTYPNGPNHRKALREMKHFAAYV